MSLSLSLSYPNYGERIDGNNGWHAVISQDGIINRYQILSLATESPERSSLDDRVDLIRKIAAKAFQEKSTICTAVRYKSYAHLFYLKMGLIPEDYPYSYAAFHYGIQGIEALNAIQTPDQTNEQMDTLRKIIAEEYGLPKLSDLEIRNMKPILKDLVDRRCSFLRDRFIPDFLESLKTNCSLGGMMMVLSNMGKERWERAIEKRTEFQIFDQYEHLALYMTPAQKQELAKILSKK